MKKKIIACITGLAIVAIIAPSSASAVTAAELQDQITALLETLAGLQSQLSELTGEPTGTITGCTITSFTRNLKVGMSGDDVKCLQIVLNTASDTQLSAGVGSPGQETSYFGPKTKAAVIKFQEKYTSVTLTPWGLTSGTGYVGTTTREKLNSLLAAGEQEEEEEEEEEEEPVASGLTARLASDTPAAASIASSATAGTNANFTKFRLSAGSEGDVKISKIYVTRSGLSANADVENIKIIEVDTGVYRGSIGSLNVDNRAMITFTKRLVIRAGTTEEFYIRAGAPANVSSGKTIKLGIASASDIVSDASGISGNFPITGNAMSVVTLTTGTATVAADGTTVDSKPDVGDTDVIVNKFKVTAGSTESITIEQITVKRTGSADTSDTANIELYDVTNAVSLGTIDNWDAEDKAGWSNLNLVVGKGSTQRFRIMLDILDGPNLTVNADLVDGSDCLMTVKGNVYGFYITADEGSFTGLGSSNQIINAGALNISKSTSTPAVGNIAAGDDIELAVFDFDSRGESIKITAITFDFTLGGTVAMTYDQVTNIAIYDEDGTIVAGPKDLAETGTKVAFTDTFITPIGVHAYTIKAKIADAVSSNDTVLVAIDRDNTASSASASGTITATGMTSGSTIYPTPYADVSANTQTVAGGDLNLVTLSTPSARSVAAGTGDFIWATGSLDAGSSGEDVQVSTISALDTTSGTTDADFIDNMELWADLTSANSARGDVYETRVTNSENPSSNADGVDVTTAFTLTQTITVAKGSFIKFALIADLNADCDADDSASHTFTFSTGTMTGASTGSDITPDVSGSGQAMVETSAGALTVTRDASSPIADIILENQTATIAVFKLAASNIEDLDVDQMTVVVSGGSSMDTIYLYDEDNNAIQSAAGADEVTFVLSDGTLTVPANGSIKVKVKVKAGTVCPSGCNTTSDTTVRARLIAGIPHATYHTLSTGLSSGTAVKHNTAVTGRTMKLYESRPYVTLSSSSPSGGLLIPSENHLLAVFDVEAASTEDITFENGDSNTFVVSISAVQSDTNAVSRTFTLKDEIGTVLDVATLDTGTNKISAISTITFNWGTETGDPTSGTDYTDLTIAAGATEQFKIYGDTRGLGDTGDSIQLWLDDSTTSNICFGINGAGTFNAEADKIFRGDILGPVWSLTTASQTD